MTLYVDAEMTAHPRAAPDARIVSLVPSITELLCALDLTPQLVGRTGFCVHPRAALRKIPKVGGTKDVDLQAIRALAPSHVVVNIDENRREAAAALREFVPHVVVTHPLGPTDNPPLMRLLGGIFGRDAQANALAAAFEQRYQWVCAQRMGPAQRVLYLIWRDPWMSVARDTYISRMLALFAWHTLPAEGTSRYPLVKLEDFVGQVDRVLLSSEPYPFRARHLAEIRAALPGVPVALINGEMTSWYGSRALEGLNYLQEFTRETLPPNTARVCA